ncbi:Tyrosine recombinase XerC [Paenibacillus auburnensis]|uniref:Tyrosine recombinase XerC n=1 Tax=Paenibacillus auburnensis TaxID=2905649 RepID=A0ABM9CA59_9BACL|nr:site-specific integrase [Paenibacillus auburnensis]CAH1208552.1 Tyrosine recombinase XerC [Paenibacillus auburnensis]
MQIIKNIQTEDDLLLKKIQVKTLIEIFNKNEFKDTSGFLEQIFNSIIKKKESKIKGTPFVRTLRPRNNNIPILENYITYYSNQGYAKSTLDNQTAAIKMFLSFLCRLHPEISPLMSTTDMNRLTKTMVIAYETYLEEQLYSGHIKKCTVNIYLDAIKKFLKMLSNISSLNISYTVPDRLKAQGKRNNDYIEVEEIKSFVDTLVLSKNTMKFRNLSIVLLVMETGCRPIEVKHIKISDFKSTERQIQLYSKKSGHRTLKISKDLCDLIMRHLEIRLTYNTDNDFLFVNIFGEQFKDPSSIFNVYSTHKIGGKHITANGLRHTYATNALDNGNDFDEVSASMGHKHRCSTEWYIHRSVKKLLNKSLPHNPIIRFSKEGK